MNIYLQVSLTAVFGLIIGSFLNVVITRLPKMLFANWTCDCEEFLGITDTQSKQESVNPHKFNLCVPCSHCPNCKAPVKFYDNIPLISYIILKGRCRACNCQISPQYPTVELLSSILPASIVYMHGISFISLLFCLLTLILICQSFIDFNHQIIPDELTMPVLWLGLIINTQGVLVPLEQAVIGAAAGYMVLWGFYQLFKLATGKEGIGFGDFKLLAMFGAWFGYSVLPAIVIMSSLVGAVVGIAMIVFCKHEKSKPIPFGPYLAIAGWIAMLWGETINTWYFDFIGI